MGLHLYGSTGNFAGNPEGIYYGIFLNNIPQKFPIDSKSFNLLFI
jgi:hypothetical protein